MNKKKYLLIIISVLFLTGCYFVCRALFSDRYAVGEDEIAIYFRLDTKEDIGLIVYYYSVDGQQYGGGLSNADRSMIRHDDEIIDVWNREELYAESDAVDFTIELRIIIEYVDPNFENIYPEEITRSIEPISWKARFGEAYDINISGDKVNGYTAILKNHDDAAR